ncbi:hypothetical protein MSAN_01851000 [Mycena sanguinolenta]|uniref:Uncharacterized protein n=1 Tax=Mycena sanguinolenta TaxID=230812 RepID=A0A8H7CQB1_9AGAR|nr:hypothetical protein MSAN_01851000 [Mycena sanguinolenta]
MIHACTAAISAPRPSQLGPSSYFGKLRIASTGFVGIRDDGGGLSPLKDFLAGGKHDDFCLVKSSGIPDLLLMPRAESVLSMKVSLRRTNLWNQPVMPQPRTFEEALTQASFTNDDLDHCRGTHYQLLGGDSFGGGQRKPGAMVNNTINTTIFLSLISHPAFQLFAGFATGVFATWAPKTFEFYLNYMAVFYNTYTYLSHPFLNGIWSSCTFNLGPCTATRPHRDHNNLAFGWCAIMVLGNFDHTRGGHLVLWDCKLIIEFPLGSTILIPSAAILHLNIPIHRNEHRYSFMQYTAGGLFRWVEQDFKSEEEYLAGLSVKEQKEEKDLGLKRAKVGAAYFSTLDKLKEILFNVLY